MELIASILVFVLVSVGIGDDPPDQRDYSVDSGQGLQLVVTSPLEVVQQRRLVTYVVYYVTYQVNYIESINYILSLSRTTPNSCITAPPKLMLLSPYPVHLSL
jgi:hypothetical protein